MTSTEAAPPALPPADPGGALGRLMQWAFGRSWRTGLAGFAVLGNAIVVAINVAVPGAVPPIAVAVGAALAGAATGIGLMHAKDARVSGLPK